MRFSKSTANCWTILGGERCGLRGRSSPVEGAPGEERLGGGHTGVGSRELGRPSLQQGLGLARWVVRTEVLVLVHLLLDGQQLALQLVAQAGQCVSDVVCQLLGVGGRQRLRSRSHVTNPQMPTGPGRDQDARGLWMWGDGGLKGGDGPAHQNKGRLRVGPGTQQSSQRCVN